MTKATEIEESELVSRLQNGDKAAIEYLYDNYSAALFGIIHRILTDRDLAEDTLQEVFVRIWNNAEKYKTNKGRLFTWMANIARNAAIDVTRSKSFKKSSKVQSLDNNVYQTEDKSRQTRPELIGLKEKVKNLDAKHVEIIEIIYYRGFTQSEAAEELEMPLGTVKSRVKIALRELKKLMTILF
ncbi:RNA polymerase sigma factor [Halocola ammonii]